MLRLILSTALAFVTLQSPASSARADSTTSAKAELLEIEVVRDLTYYEGSDAHPRKHKLDLYLPKGCKDFPVLFFVHGGGWRHGDKNYFADIYGRLGQAFARQGIGTVVINYRLSPEVQHPIHVQDVARAFAWTYRHIARYGGRPDQIFISGHSAGGHLVALLATDPRYLEAEKLGIKHVKGVLALSGVYHIPQGTLFSSVFTAEDDKRKDASPIHHVNGKHPPFLIVYAESDFPTCDEMSEGFCKVLRQHQCSACTVKIADRDHNTIIIRLYQENDPAQEAMLEFLTKQTGRAFPLKTVQFDEKK
jgi:acetyl esterase/lipase